MIGSSLAPSSSFDKYKYSLLKFRAVVNPLLGNGAALLDVFSSSHNSEAALALFAL